MVTSSTTTESSAATSTLGSAATTIRSAENTTSMRIAETSKSNESTTNDPRPQCTPICAEDLIEQFSEIERKMQELRNLEMRVVELEKLIRES